PAEWSERLEKKLGPMVDFVDNYPAQLVHVPEDKQTFLEESAMSFAWHEGLAGVASREMGANAVIQNIYSPNQMLTSRWWLGYVDPASRRFHDKSAAERAALWAEVRHMYQQMDGILGEVLRAADPDTVIVLSSDHGA